MKTTWVDDKGQILVLIIHPGPDHLFEGLLRRDSRGSPVAQEIERLWRENLAYSEPKCGGRSPSRRRSLASRAATADSSRWRERVSRRSLRCNASSGFAISPRARRSASTLDKRTAARRMRFGACDCPAKLRLADSRDRFRDGASSAGSDIGESPLASASNSRFGSPFKSNSPA